MARLHITIDFTSGNPLGETTVTVLPPENATPPTPPTPTPPTPTPSTLRQDVITSYFKYLKGESGRIVLNRDTQTARFRAWRRAWRRHWQPLVQRRIVPATGYFLTDTELSGLSDEDLDFYERWLDNIPAWL